MPRKFPSFVPGKTWIVLSLIGMIAVIAGVLLPQALPAGAAADPQPLNPAPGNLSYTPPAWPEQPNHKDMLLRLVLGTAVVLGLCVCTLWVGKRWLAGKPAVAAPNAQMRHIESLTLASRCWIQLVQVADKPILVGGDHTGLKTIVPLPESFSTLLETKSAIPPESGLAPAFSAPTRELG